MELMKTFICVKYKEDSDVMSQLWLFINYESKVCRYLAIYAWKIYVRQ